MSKLTIIMAAVGVACSAGFSAAILAQDRPPVPPAADEAVVVQGGANDPLILQVQPASPGKELSEKERAAAEKELADLRSQRSKLDSRIREVERKLGRTTWTFTLPHAALRPGEGWGAAEMTPEQRAQLKRQMANAREDMRRAAEEMKRALRENLRALPEAHILTVPPTPVAPVPEVAPPADQELRAQIEELRREVEKLRDEINHHRGQTDQRSGAV